MFKLFNVLSSNEIFYYLDCDILSKISTYNTHGAVDRKFNAFKHNRNLDNFVFNMSQYVTGTVYQIILRYVQIISNFIQS